MPRWCSALCSTVMCSGQRSSAAATKAAAAKAVATGQPRRCVRKAISMAIDRQLVVDVALYRYSRPADATGLSAGEIVEVVLL